MSGERTKDRHPAGFRQEEGRYANLFQVGHNAFEFLIEFGQETGGIHTRIYVSPQHAHILSDLLLDALRQHQQMYNRPPENR